MLGQFCRVKLEVKVKIHVETDHNFIYSKVFRYFEVKCNSTSDNNTPNAESTTKNTNTLRT